MVTSGPTWLRRNQLLISGLMVSLLLAAMVMIFLFAPAQTMWGDTHRIVYLYASVAWCGLLAFVVVGVAGVAYLLRRDLAWDHWSRAAAESGWLCSSLALVTGAMWAHESHGAWWVSDSRSLLSMSLWLLFAGQFLARAGQREPHRRARLNAVLGIAATLNLPLIALATWWLDRGPPALAELEPRVWLVLTVSGIGFTAFFAFLTMQRRWQLGLEEQVAALEWRIDIASRVLRAEDAPWSHF